MLCVCRLTVYSVPAEAISVMGRGTRGKNKEEKIIKFKMETETALR